MGITEAGATLESLGDDLYTPLDFRDTSEEAVDEEISAEVVMDAAYFDVENNAGLTLTQSLRQRAAEYGRAAAANLAIPVVATIGCLAIVRITNSGIFNRTPEWEKARADELQAQQRYEELAKDPATDRKEVMRAHDAAQAAWRVRMGVENDIVEQEDQA